MYLGYSTWNEGSQTPGSVGGFCKPQNACDTPFATGAQVGSNVEGWCWDEKKPGTLNDRGGLGRVHVPALPWAMSTTSGKLLVPGINVIRCLLHDGGRVQSITRRYGLAVWATELRAFLTKGRQELGLARNLHEATRWPCSAQVPDLKRISRICILHQDRICGMQLPTHNAASGVCALKG